jgi:hypothetical protein
MSSSAQPRHDRVFEGFLHAQCNDAMAFAASSDFVTLIPVQGVPPCRYLARFTCRGLVRRNGLISAWEDFAVGFYFPDDYLARVNPFQIVSWLGPEDVWHSNIGRGPQRAAGPLGICTGEIRSGTPLVDLIYRVADVITWRLATVREDDALNWEACQWARRHPDLYPVDLRPLRRCAPEPRARSYGSACSTNSADPER